MKKLPKPEKNLKNFILGEDAKIIDKTVTKVALIASFASFAFTQNIQDANAKGHSNHSNHSNVLYGDHNDDAMSNDLNSTYTTTKSASGHSMSVVVPPKSAQAVHGNHYNHGNGGGGSS